QIVRHAALGRRHALSHDPRRARALVRARAPTPRAAGAASRAAGVHRRAGASVRLLLQRHYDQGRGAACAESTAERGRDPHRDEWPSLPLRRVPADPEGYRARFARARPVSDDTALASFPRRDLLKAGGALLIGFAVPAARAQEPLGIALMLGPDQPDQKRLDTW